MAVRREVIDAAIYRAARVWVDRCLRGDGALFSDAPVWTAERVEELHAAVFASFDDSKGSFMAKLARELEGASDEVIQLVAELLFVHLLVPSDIKEAKKRELVASVLAQCDQPPAPPEELLIALRRGFAKTGVAYRTYRFHQLRYFVDVIRRWKALSEPDGERLLDDPWAFKAFLYEQPMKAAFAQREALLHLVHPDTFESIVSREYKRQIADAFAALVPEEVRADVDRALLEIRSALEAEAGGPIHFFDPEYRSRWDPTLTAPWDELARWARPFLAWGGFRERERAARETTSQELASVRQRAQADDEGWQDGLARVLAGSGLVNPRLSETLSRWLHADPDDARRALGELWDSSRGLVERVERFCRAVAVAGTTTGARLQLASVLLLADAPARHPLYRSHAVDTYYALARQDPPVPEVGDGERYGAYCMFLDTVVEQLRARDVSLDGRMDAHDLLWSMSQLPADHEPIASLPEAERQAFLAWRGDSGADEGLPDFASETQRRRLRLEQLASSWRQEVEADNAKERRPYDADTVRRRSRAVSALLDELAATRDLGAFAAAVRASDLVFPHVRTGAHQKFLRGLAAAAEDPVEAARLVERVYRVPSSWEVALAGVRELAEFAAATGGPGYPAAGMAPLAASSFWHMQEPGWLPLYESVERVLKAWGWLQTSDDAAERYQRYVEFFRQHSHGDEDATIDQIDALSEVGRGWFGGLDPTLVERCEENLALLQGADDAESRETGRRNARTLLSDLKLVGRSLDRDIAEALARSVHPVVSQQDLAIDDRARADGFVAWRVEGVSQPAPDIRLWVTPDGVAIGLYPGNRRDWYSRAWRALADRVPRDYQRLEVHVPGGKRALLPAGTDVDEEREFLAGRWLPGTEALGRPDLADDLVALARRLRPGVEALIAAAGGTSQAIVDGSEDPLAPAVRRFLAERGYPDAKARQNASDRAELARALEPGALTEQFDLPTFRQIINTNRYGGPGPQAVLNTTLSKASPEELLRIAANIDYLLWGDNAVAHRIDELLDRDRRGVPGLGESVVMKLLAIAHPDRFLPVFPVRGEMGKWAMLEALDLTFDITGMSAGQVQVEANDRLRSRLDAFFPGDTFAMKEFLYWLRSQAEEEAVAGDVDRIAEAAAELHLEEDFLRELVALLEDKGQIILYGPPGTGKTYLAKRLARALVDEDESRYRLVQFHPSYSYEDFFEGYRPVTDSDGRLSYRLVPGPLAQVVEAAENAPGATHVMVIDEINRANLPKVFGELLFLLEYRDEPVHTQYRPDESFSMPKKLYFIGTMNTADRSIALIDAALRRRFHFVPFFPHEGAIAGVLRSWLAANGERQDVADLLDMVNEELRNDLGGPHLQVGPSHFMRKGLDDEQLQRIWTYSVFPYIEEQLFGDEATIARYTFDAVWRRFRGRRAPSGAVEPDGEG